VKKSNVKILDSRVANWDRGQARSAIRRFSGAIDAVFAAADDMILGAIDAMSEAGIDPASKVTVGFDAIPEALNYMERGRLSATVDQLAAKQAGQAIEHIGSPTSRPRRSRPARSS
jgi:ABC-type sugar transport system substrate-binding protein